MELEGEERKDKRGLNLGGKANKLETGRISKEMRRKRKIDLDRIWENKNRRTVVEIG